MTFEEAMQAGMKAGDEHAEANGRNRKEWDESDAQAAAAEYNRLWPEPKAITPMPAEPQEPLCVRAGCFHPKSYHTLLGTPNVCCYAGCVCSGYASTRETMPSDKARNK